MIGPCKQKMPDRFICTGCDAVKTKHTVKTQLFEARTFNYCSNFPNNGIQFIKKFPFTPKWCPAMKAVEP